MKGLTTVSPWPDSTTSIGRAGPLITIPGTSLARAGAAYLRDGMGGALHKQGCASLCSSSSKQRLPGSRGSTARLSQGQQRASRGGPDHEEAKAEGFQVQDQPGLHGEALSQANRKTSSIHMAFTQIL